MEAVGIAGSERSAGTAATASGAGWRPEALEYVTFLVVLVQIEAGGFNFRRRT